MHTGALGGVLTVLRLAGAWLDARRNERRETEVWRKGGDGLAQPLLNVL